MKKDYGKYISSQYIQKELKTECIYGIDPNEKNIDENGYITHWETKEIYTEAAKITKKIILEKFLESSDTYLMILEDDIYLLSDASHNMKFFIDQTNNFLRIHTPNILYLGASNYSAITTNPYNKLSFEQINCNRPITGAYSIIIHRNIIDALLIRINNTSFYGDPFDITCLNYVTKMFPNKTFITNPQIFIPDCTASNIRKIINEHDIFKLTNTNPINYIIPCKCIVFVRVIDHESFEYFKKNIIMVSPIIKAIYYSDNISHNNAIIHKTLKHAQEYAKIYKLEKHIMMTTTDKFEYFSAESIISKYI